MMIEWKAPEQGTVYLVEKQTGKIIETRSLEEGEVYSFAAKSAVQADEFEQMLGIRFSRAHFQLYFEPADEEGSESVCRAPA
jgi:preprotein translocase subunit SecA